MNINNSKNNSSNNNEADSQTEFVNEFAVELDFLGKSLAGRSKKQYTLFMDFLCPYCGKFHQQYGQILKKRLAEGYINLKIIPLAWIDFYSNGHHYSIRAARAAEIVFRNQPELAWDFIELLLKRGVQPREAANYDPEQGSNLHLAKLAASLGAGGEGAGGKGSGGQRGNNQGVSEQVLKEIENISDSDSLAKSMEKEAEIIRQNNLIPGTPSLFIDGKLWDFAAKL